MVQNSDEGLSVDQALQIIQDISTLPHIALKVIEVIGNPSSSASNLKQVVEGDPALSARVLRTVNSALYGLSCEVANIQRAISLLGFDEIRNIAITASIAEIFKSEETIGAYSRIGLWKHLVSVGVGARLIASRCGLSHFEDAFLGGLLHDFGIILIDQYFHEKFRNIMLWSNKQLSFYDAECRVLGFDHALLGMMMAERWHFPPVTRACIRYHHHSHLCKNQYQPMVQVVEVANFLCCSKMINATGRAFVYERPNETVFESLKLNRQDLKVLWDDLDTEIAKSKTLLDIS